MRKRGIDWITWLVVALVVAFVVILVATAGAARGAEPDFAAFGGSFEAFGEQPAAGVRGVTVVPSRGAAAPPPVLLGWRHWDGMGREWFEPAGEVRPAYPFGPTGMIVPSADVTSTASPAPAPSPGRTGTLVLPAIRGGTNCSPFG